MIIVSATGSNGTQINADKETRISVNLCPSRNQVAETIINPVSWLTLKQVQRVSVGARGLEESSPSSSPSLEWLLN